MKILKVMFFVLVILGLAFSSAFAAGDAAKGKALFNDVKFGGGTSGKSCNSCHPDGKSLEGAADKKELKLMGKSLKSIEEVVNVCIKGPMKGKGIDIKSADMANIVAYLKSLKATKSSVPVKEDKPKKKDPPIGC